VGGLQASTRFLGVDAIRLSGDRRLQAERTKAGAPLPMALLVKLDRLAEALHLT
jgi:LDH2 family malate/lactate/ureidoglycolate dehydrogenase